AQAVTAVTVLPRLTVFFMRALKAQASEVQASKAQVSLELLIVIAALAVLLVAFLPFVSETREAANYAAVAKREQAILVQTAADCRAARLGGAGSLFLREWALSTATNFSFTDDGANDSGGSGGSGSVLRAEFFAGGKQRSVEEDVGFSVRLFEAALAAGRIAVAVENKAGVVEIVFQESK
ncbi:MAG: hypothetical protein V1817_04970, partial [Candidatus Micrarchaeota archaeon]